MTSHGPLLLAAGVVLAVALGWALWVRRRPTALELFAAALLAYPVSRALVAAAAVAERLTRYTVLLPAPREAFVLGVVRDVGFSILLPLAGALLLWRGLAGPGPARTLRDVRDALARALAPIGLRLGAPGWPGLRDGLALLGLALVLQFLALAAQGSIARVLVTGDESRLWQNLDWGLVLVISLAAGIGEELVWRGALLRALLQRMPWLGAVLLQAALFGFIHAGYGNWAHVVGPALFGALMGLVALRLGLLPAMVVHAGIDVAYLALVGPFGVVGQGVAAALTLAGLVALAAARGAPVKALLRPRLA
jgi:membrane protease YdiL (CAAX protease family)